MHPSKNIRWDLFHRSERRNRDLVRGEDNVKHISFELPSSWMLAQALEYAWAHGLARGSHRGGCFQVQNDLGIYNQVDGNKIDLSTPAKAAKTMFKTWEQLEAEELANAV